MTPVRVKLTDPAEADPPDGEEHGQDAISPEPGKAGKGPTRPGFVLFMLALTVLFAYLGKWQLDRLAQKEAMLAAIDQRIDLPAVPLPPSGEWVGFDAEIYDFRPIVVSGTFDHARTVRVFTSLVSPRGSYSGPGYWIVAPLHLETGGILFVNRGFVPQDKAEAFADGGAGSVGPVTITGIGRISEKVNSFTPVTDFANRVEWVRNIDRLSQFLEVEHGPVAPIYLDAAATEPGALPQGGETKLTVTNRHLEYALTWFSLAILTPLMLLFWWRRKRSS
ncbi:MAG TPA: SURF1 family protein [Devosia sp.]|nr:SURF1 family protein [Devosia sp.]